MKKIITIKFFTFFVAFVAISCNNQKQGMQDSQPTYFANTGDAVKKAKADLLEILRTNKEFAAGVDAATLEKAEPAQEVSQVQLDFNKLLSADSTSTLSTLSGGTSTTIIPLVADNKVATIVELVRSDSGWTIAGMAGKSVSDDLTMVRAAAGDGAESITSYEVPNLQAKVYAVKKGSEELLYTNFNGYSLRQGVSAAQLLPALRSAAQEFQRLYGDQIKQQKLVR